MNRLALLWATWFGCGLLPKAPGTAGSLGALLVALPLLMWCRWQPWHLLPLTLVLLLPSIWAADRTAAVRNSKDPQLVVVDEVLGQWIALAFVPALAPGWFAAAFLLFRAFDIWKPWPVRSLERLPGGTGIVADDIAAGAWAALVLKLAGWLNHL